MRQTISTLLAAICAALVIVVGTHTPTQAQSGLPGRPFSCNVAVSTATTITNIGSASTNPDCIAQGANKTMWITDVMFGSSAAGGTAADSFPTLKYADAGSSCATNAVVFWTEFTLANTTVWDNIVTPIQIPPNKDLCWIMSTGGSKVLRVGGYIN